MRVNANKTVQQEGTVEHMAGLGIATHHITRRNGVMLKILQIARPRMNSQNGVPTGLSAMTA